MWIFTRYGFYSIACARKPDGSIDPTMMMIRARRKSHLARLQSRFPELATAEIIKTENTDYRYRLVVSKSNWIAALTELAEEQTWSNFKSETARFQGQAGTKYLHALHDVWSVMYRMQGAD